MLGEKKSKQTNKMKNLVHSNLKTIYFPDKPQKCVQCVWVCVCMWVGARENNEKEKVEAIEV